MEYIEAINEFLEIYIDESTIKKIVYSNKRKKWVLKFIDKTKLEFLNFNEMVCWLNSDQFGD